MRVRARAVALALHKERGESEETGTEQDITEESHEEVVAHPQCPLAGLVELARSFGHLEAQDWPEEEAQRAVAWVESHDRLSCPDPNCWGTAIQSTTIAYMEMHPAPEPPEKPAPRGVLADELLPIIRGLAGRSFTEWETHEIDALVAALAGVRSIDVAHSSAEAKAVYGDFDFELSRLVESRPDIAERIDPVYIFVDITAGLPTGYAATIAAMPPALGVHVQNGRNWVLGVAGGTTPQQELNARHAGGILSGSHPGLSWWLVKANTPLAYW